MTAKIVDPSGALQNRERDHAEHGAQREDRVKAAVARDHFVQPRWRTRFQADVAVQERAGDSKRVIEMLLRGLCGLEEHQGCDQAKNNGHDQIAPCRCRSLRFAHWEKRCRSYAVSNRDGDSSCPCNNAEAIRPVQSKLFSVALVVM